MTWLDVCIHYAKNVLNTHSARIDHVHQQLSIYPELLMRCDLCDLTIEQLYENLKSLYHMDTNEKERHIDWILGQLTDEQSVVNHIFWHKYNIDAEEATRYLYRLGQLNHYIQTEKIARNLQFSTPQTIVTINLSKEEKDNKKIAEEAKKIVTDFPKCSLCYENVGYRGTGQQPPRSTLRVAEMKLDNEEWFMQFSPYPYFEEHAIFIDKIHRPMKVDRQTLIQLCDIVDTFPHYFVGSNAAKPIIGGSILSHAHFQGGKIQPFPLMKAAVDKTYYSSIYKNVSIYTLQWPSFVLRLESKHREELINCSMAWMNAWECYDAPEIHLYSHTNHQSHHGTAPILFKKQDIYVMHLIFRSNFTTPQYPDGLYHAYPEHHHIKKEGIGLIEAMGMFILPGRLASVLHDYRSMTSLEDFNQLIEKYPIHRNWMLQYLQPLHIEHHDLETQFINALDDVCVNILSNISVFKKDHIGQWYQDQFMTLMK